MTNATHTYPVNLTTWTIASEGFGGACLFASVVANPTMIMVAKRQAVHTGLTH